MTRWRDQLALGRRLRLGVGRVTASWWSIGQSAVAGALAWELAVRLLHHPAPFFAAVAAIVCLSSNPLNRLRRVGELALGVTVGVSLGDLLIGQIGRGGWQLGLVVLLAMSAALLLDGGTLVVNQAALQAVFVAVLPPPPGGYLARWEDALLGGLVALVVAAALPGDPRPALRRHVNAVVPLVAGELRQVAAAVRDRDAERVADALELLRATQPALDRWRDAVRAGEEITLLSPLRRHARAEVAAHRRGQAPVDRAVRNLRVAVRRLVAAVEDENAYRAQGVQFPALDGGQHRVPEPLLAALDAVAGALFTLPGALRDADGEGGRRLRAALDRAAAGLDPAALDARSMHATVVAAQLRSAVVDLLLVTGLPPAQARAALPR